MQTPGRRHLSLLLCLSFMNIPSCGFSFSISHFVIRAFLVFATVSVHASWRSSLYPEDWKPGFADAEGRSLQDFSYAGYHRGEKELPERTGELIDVTAAAYGADPKGEKDSTLAIQAALDAAAKAGGGIVFLPSGTYRIAPPAGEKVALRVEGDNIVLRGAGAGKTFLFNDSFDMRAKTVIEVNPPEAAYWYADGQWVKSAPATADFPMGSTKLPVADPSLFQPGDPVIVRNDMTDAFIAYLGMTGKWTKQNTKNRGLIFFRRIVSTDPVGGTVTVDAPLRFAIRKDDGARVVKLPGRIITEVGLEDFSLGMKEHPGEGWGEDDFGVEGTAAYDVHQSHAIVFTSAEDCWMQRVNSWCPPGNSPTTHVVSNGVKFQKSRQITAQDCDWQHAQYKGGGGNGYLFTLQASDCLLRSCRATAGRHNYDFGTTAATGNVLHDCLGKDGRLGSDFHMFFSVTNLLDSMTCDGDFLEARYRPWGGTPVHGVTTSETVFWNTKGLRYISSPFQMSGKMHERPQILVQSEQFGNGYVIGTRGPASAVKTTNFLEGEGKGDTLEPQSLYLDQLKRRLGR
jgi:hypothetical protein